MKNILTIILILVLAGFNLTFGQELTLNTHYYFNKQLFNPSFLTENEWGSINFIHKRQWIGINDAPVVNYFNVQYPLNNNFGIGLNISNGKAVLLNNFNSMISAAYKVHFSQGHFLSFGLAIGVNFNNLDLSEIENVSQDPVLIGAMKNAIDPDGRFGINYTYKKLNVGLAFTQLFGPYKFAENNFENIKVNPLNNFLVSANYKFIISNDHFTITPYVVYEFRNFDYLLNIIEGVAFFEYKNLLSLGVGYNSLGEITGHFMLTYNSKFRFRYSYDAPQTNQRGISNGSHEFQVGYLFNRQKIHNPHSSTKYVAYETSSKYQLPNNNSSAIGKDNSPTVELRIKTIKLYEGSIPDFFEMEKGYYIVFGEFDSSKKAEKLNYKLIAKKIKATIGYSSVSDQYIVFYYKTSNLNDLNIKYENDLLLLKEFEVYGLQIK